MWPAVPISKAASSQRSEIGNKCGLGARHQTPQIEPERTACNTPYHRLRKHAESLLQVLDDPAADLAIGSDDNRRRWQPIDRHAARADLACTLLEPDGEGRT